jgi:hypothetical protein
MLDMQHNKENIKAINLPVLQQSNGNDVEVAPATEYPALLHDQVCRRLPSEIILKYLNIQGKISF